jgi:hypothetical protein
MFLHNLCRNLCTSHRHRGLPRCDLQVGDGGFPGNSVRQPPSGVLVAQKPWLQARHLSRAWLFFIERLRSGMVPLGDLPFANRRLFAPLGFLVAPCPAAHPPKAGACRRRCVPYRLRASGVRPAIENEVTQDERS